MFQITPQHLGLHLTNQTLPYPNPIDPNFFFFPLSFSTAPLLHQLRQLPPLIHLNSHQTPSWSLTMKTHHHYHCLNNQFHLYSRLSSRRTLGLKQLKLVDELDELEAWEDAGEELEAWVYIFERLSASQVSEFWNFLKP